jgi:hypothetical protein
MHSLEQRIAFSCGHFVEATSALQTDPVRLALLSGFDSTEDLIEILGALGDAHAFLDRHS